MQDLNLKQLALGIKQIADEKNLPEETVHDIIEQAIAAAFRRDFGDREQEVRAELKPPCTPLKKLLKLSAMNLSKLALKTPKRLIQTLKLKVLSKLLAIQPLLVVLQRRQPSKLFCKSFAKLNAKLLWKNTKTKLVPLL